MPKVRVCGQCSEPTNNEEWGCPHNRCNLVLCATCSNEEVHIRQNGHCPPWWGSEKTTKEIHTRIQEITSQTLQNIA